jgi:2,2-dialkylglycine decarboxylase (pyruvate)
MDPDLRDAAKEYLVRYGGDVFPNLFRSAKGTIVRDSHGREYLDFTSGQMCATIGHNHPAIVAAVHRAGEKAFHFFSGMIPEVVAELARTLAHDWLPGDLKRTIFINTGSEATEVALRMAKMYTGGYEILVLGGSWHGITGGASSVSMASDRKGYGIPTPGVFVIPEPNAYRPLIPGLDAERVGARRPRPRIEAVRHAIRRAGRRHHGRAGDQRRWRLGAAEIIHASPPQGSGRPWHAADFR